LADCVIQPILITVPARSETTKGWRRAIDSESAVVRETLAAAREQAGQLLKQTHEYAVEKVAEAHREAFEIEQNAYASGYQAGQEKAKAEQEQLSERLAQEVQTAIAELNRQNREKMSQLEPEILELSLQVAEKVIALELSRQDKAYVFLVRSALRQLQSKEPVQVRISDQELAHLTGRIVEAIEAESPQVSVCVDSQLAKGTCQIESESGTIDASVAVQLQNIRQSLQPVLA
jgi:flagellar assembly protein FliH